MGCNLRCLFVYFHKPGSYGQNKQDKFTRNILLTFSGIILNGSARHNVHISTIQHHQRNRTTTSTLHFHPRLCSRAPVSGTSLGNIRSSASAPACESLLSGIQYGLWCQQKQITNACVSILVRTWWKRAAGRKVPSRPYLDGTLMRTDRWWRPWRLLES